MRIESNEAEQKLVLDVAQAMCAAARTAPKSKGTDNLYTVILTGDDMLALADEMERLSPELGYGFFLRDAGNIRNSDAVVLFGAAHRQYGLGKGCSLCNFDGCDDCIAHNAKCIFEPLDLGIALGSAVSIAADARVDNRVLFSAGRAALGMGLLPEEVKTIMAVPLSVKGKSPYFDRKPKNVQK